MTRKVNANSPIDTVSDMVIHSGGDCFDENTPEPGEECPVCHGDGRCTRSKGACTYCGGSGRISEMAGA